MYQGSIYVSVLMSYRDIWLMIQKSTNTILNLGLKIITDVLFNLFINDDAFKSSILALVKMNDLDY